jgi:hypothetical protein
MRYTQRRRSPFGPAFLASAVTAGVIAGFGTLSLLAFFWCFAEEPFLRAPGLSFILVLLAGLILFISGQLSTRIDE